MVYDPNGDFDEEYDTDRAEDARLERAERRQERARQRRWCPDCRTTGRHRPNCPNDDD